MFNKDIASLRVVVGADIGKFRKGMKQAQTQLKTTGAKMKGFISSVGVALPAAAAAGGAAFIAMMHKVTTWADTIAKSAKQAGVSVQFLSEMEYASKRAGAQLSDVMNGIRRMAKAASDANRGMVTYQRAFNELGISVNGANGQLKTTEVLFMEVLGALREMENATQRAAIAQEVFGRGGMRILPLLSENVDDLRSRFKKLSGVLSDDTARSAEKFRDSMTDVETALRGVQIAIMERAGPPLTAFLNHLAEDIPKFTGNVFETGREVWGRAPEGRGGYRALTPFDDPAHYIDPSKGWGGQSGMAKPSSDFVGPLPWFFRDMPKDVDTTDLGLTSDIQQKQINKALGQTKQLHHSLTQIETDYEDVGQTAIVSVDKIVEWSNQAAEAAGHVAEGVYVLFDALEAEDFWGTLWQNTRRYFQMLIAESIRSKSYAWFVGAFSGGNAMVGANGAVMPTGNPNLAMAPAGGGSVNVTLVNNSGMPLEASAQMGAGGLEVVLEGPVKKLFNSGRLDGTMKQFNAYRRVGA